MLPMATAYESPTEYIQHHLTFLTQPVAADGGFWTINVDTMIMSVVLGVVAFGFMWLVTRKATSGVPSKTQAFVELLARFRQRARSRASTTATTRLVAPIALTTFVLVLFMNAMDFLPVDIMARRCSAIGVPLLPHRADRRRQHDVRAGARRCSALMIFYAIKDQGPRRLDPRALLLAVRRQPARSGSSTCSSTSSSTCRSRCRIRCGSSATCTPARSSSCCSACWPRPASSASSSAPCLHVGWSIFHILIVAAAGLHLHDADRRLHRDGARAPLTHVPYSVNVSSTSTPANERKQQWTSCKCSR